MGSHSYGGEPSPPLPPEAYYLAQAPQPPAPPLGWYQQPQHQPPQYQQPYYGGPVYPAPPIPPFGYGQPVARPRARVPGWLLLVSAALAALGTLLPWATISAIFASVSINGTSTGDGKLFLGVAIVSGVFATLIATGVVNKFAAIPTLIGGLVIGFGGAYDLVNVSNRFANTSGVLAQVGAGLYLTAAAGFGLLILSIVILALPKARQ